MINKILMTTAAFAALTVGAHAADLMVPPAAASAVAPVTSSWDGPYIGASIGYGPGIHSRVKRFQLVIFGVVHLGDTIGAQGSQVVPLKGPCRIVLDKLVVQL